MDREPLQDHAGISALHDEIFGPTSFSRSDRFERIAALVTQILEPSGWVIHDIVVAATLPAKSENQIDVVLVHTDGETRHVLIECRFYKAPIEKKDAQAHWAAAEQAGAQAVMISTAKFRSGAITYAKDKQMSLIHVRRFEEADREGRIMEVRMQATMTFPIGPNVVISPTPAEVERLTSEGLRTPFRVDEVAAMWEHEIMRTEDGHELGLALDVLAARGCSNDVGETTVDFSPPVFVDFWGEHVLIDSLVWSVGAETTTFPIVAGRGLGEPRLVAIDVAHETYNKAIFDRSLKRLAIASNGQVVEHARLHMVEEQLRRAAPSPDEPKDGEDAPG